MLNDVRKLGFNVLLGIAFYLPLEEFLLSWVPLPKLGILVLRQLPEVFVWLITLVVAALHLAKHGTIRLIGQKTDRFLIGFLIIAAAGIYLNGANLFLAAISLKALVRFILLVYALILLAPSPEDCRKVPKVILWAIGIQVVVGTAEWLIGQPAREFFSVIHVWGGFSFVGRDADVILGWERQDVNGTIARSIGYAYFLLVGYMIWLVKTEKKPVLYVLGTLVTIVLTYQAHSRMAVFSVVLMLLVHQILVKGFRRTSVLAFAAVPLVALVMLSLGSEVITGDYLSDVLSDEYQNRAQRLGLVTYMLPNVFDGGVTLLGHSSDITIVTQAVESHFDLPPFVADVFAGVVEDVYWLALLLYFGFLGLGFFAIFYGKNIAIQWRLFKNARDKDVREFAQIALLLLLLAIPLNMINQTFEVRTFAYYLWFFVGLALVSGNNALQKESTKMVESKE